MVTPSKITMRWWNWNWAAYDDAMILQLRQILTRDRNESNQQFNSKKQFSSFVFVVDYYSAHCAPLWGRPAAKFTNLHWITSNSCGNKHSITWPLRGLKSNPTTLERRTEPSAIFNKDNKWHEQAENFANLQLLNLQLVLYPARSSWFCTTK